MPNLIKGAYEAMQPDGSIHAQDVGGDTDLMFDGIADNETRVQVLLATLAKIRDPFLTPILADLEKEYGIITDLDLTELERRENLAALVYATKGTGSRSYLEARLHEAGFTDLFVYNNSPAVDPNLFITSGYGSYCDDEETVCGNEEAYCSLYDGGEYVVNGDIYDQSVDQLAVCGNEDIVCGNGDAFAGSFQELKELVEYTVPSATDSADLLIDGDMEEPTVNATDWPDTEGGAAASKSLVAPYTGVRSLQVDDGRTLDVIDGNNGVDELPDDLVINGTTIPIKAKYYGIDANLTDFPAQTGPTLLITGSGTDPELQQLAYGNGVNDLSVRGKGGEYWKGQLAADLDLGTGDLFFNFILRTPADPSSLSELINKVSGGDGYFSFINANALDFRLYNSSALITASSPSLTGLGGQFAMFSFFVNRDEASVNGSAVFLNDTAGSGVDMSSISGTLSNAALVDFVELVDGELLYFAMWEQADMFSAGATGLAEAQAAATHRLQLWTNVYGDPAGGTPEPITNTAEKTFIEQYVAGDLATYLQHISDDVAPVGRVLDGLGAEFEGYRLGPAGENMFYYSKDFQTGWVQTACTVDTASGVDAPDISENVQGLVGDVGTASHYYRVIITPTAADHSLSVYARKGARVFLKVRNSVGDYCWFNTTTGAVGSSSVGSSGKIFDADNDDWYRCVFTWPALAGAISVYLYPADSDTGASNPTYNGDGSTIDMYFWGAQAEPGTDATSPIETNGAPDTRAADELAYDLTDGNIVQGQGTVDFNIHIPYGSSSSANQLLSMDDGTSNNRIRIVSASSGVLIVEVKTGGVTQSSTPGSIAVDQGGSHSIRMRYEDGDLRLWIDDVLDITATPTTIPTGLTQAVFSSAEIITWVSGGKFYGTLKEPGDVAALTRPQTKGQRYYMIAWGRNTSLESKPQIKDGDTVTIWEGVDTDSEWEFIEREWVAVNDTLKLTMDGEIGIAGFDNMALFERSLNGNWNLVFFVGGAATYDSGGRIIDIERVTIQGNLRDSLRRIILRHKPLQTWGALVVDFGNSGGFGFGSFGAGSFGP